MIHKMPPQRQKVPSGHSCCLWICSNHWNIRPVEYCVLVISLTQILRWTDTIIRWTEQFSAMPLLSVPPLILCKLSDVLWVPIELMQATTGSCLRLHTNFSPETGEALFSVVSKCIQGTRLVYIDEFVRLYKTHCSLKHDLQCDCIIR